MDGTKTAAEIAQDYFCRTRLERVIMLSHYLQTELEELEKLGYVVQKVEHASSTIELWAHDQHLKGGWSS